MIGPSAARHVLFPSGKSGLCELCTHGARRKPPCCQNGTDGGSVSHYHPASLIIFLLGRCLQTCFPAKFAQIASFNVMFCHFHSSSALPAWQPLFAQVRPVRQPTTASRPDQFLPRTAPWSAHAPAAFAMAQKMNYRWRGSTNCLSPAQSTELGIRRAEVPAAKLSLDR